jgi:GTPase SAR1 family protein
VASRITGDENLGEFFYWEVRKTLDCDGGRRTLTEEINDQCPVGATQGVGLAGRGACYADLDFILSDLLTETSASVVNPSASEEKLLKGLDVLRHRLVTGRFQLAVLGQFKRGKSTLLNALLGADALPTGILPVTAIPTFLREAPTTRLHVTFTAGCFEESHATSPQMLRERLSALVSETGNPHNVLGVSRVEVFLPSELLAHGLVLIDTPGVGSTFHHNTAGADAVLAESDAALFVVSPDPPITEVEVQFLARIREKVERVIVVLNKTDTLEPDEVEPVASFLRGVLAEQAGLDKATPIFCLSGRRGLRARLAGDLDTLKASGLAQLEAHLVQFLAQEKQATLRKAIVRKASALIGALQMETEIRLKALRLPLADLEQRIAAFDEAASRFEAERRAAADLLAGDRVRAFAELEEEAEKLRTQGRGTLVSVLDRTLGVGGDAEQARAALAETMISYFDAALVQTISEVGKRLATTLRTHQDRADKLIAIVRRTATDLLEIPFQASENSDSLEVRHDPFWVTSARTELLGAVAPRVLERFLPRAARRVRLRKRLVEQMEAALLRNVENLRWATRQNLEETFRRFGADLDERLGLSLVATRGAMATVLDLRGKQSASVQAEIESALVTLSLLNAMQTAFGSISWRTHDETNEHK